MSVNLMIVFSDEDVMQRNVTLRNPNYKFIKKFSRGNIITPSMSNSN